MVFMPRGAAKSTYSSIVFPSKYLGEAPDRRLILASYGEDLPRKNGRRTRSIIKQKRYQRLFNCELSKDSSAVDQFALTNGSEYMASGIGASIVGNRAHGIVIDDPVKNRQEARSETKRETTWDSYKYDLLPCLIPGGWVVLVMTRWDPDDIAGRILPENWKGDSGYFDCRDGMPWRVLCLQAKCETHTDPLGRKLGEYLWPEWFKPSHWVPFERDPMQWSSMYQQLPRPMEGSFFTESMFLVPSTVLGADGKPVLVPAEKPKVLNYVFAVIDSASKTGKKHDGTGVVYFGRSHNLGGPPLQILDWDYTQIQAASLIDWLPGVFRRLEELAKECRAVQGSKGAWIEDQASGTVLLQQAANKGLPARKIDSKLTALGKVGRGENASPYVAAGDVKITREAYEKVVTFKDSTKNHLMAQLLGFDIATQDTAADDLFDGATYGIAIALGNPQGF